MNSFTSYLYAKPSLLEGISRLIDLGNTLQVYNTSPSDNQADALALYSDWLTVGNDLRNAMSQYENEYSQIEDDLMKQAHEALKIAYL
ncbi:MAG: hypothetical protein PUP93_33995 [Rhizonema sp. NSF051]|nr:hypothetical protein [Rhizonema sp. NSF051]